MGRKPCCEKVGLRRGPWTAEEDGKLVSYITTNGICCWRAIPKLAGLLRCGKSCRLRWTNYLRPDLKRGIFTEEEENLILDLHATLGNRWSRIAAQLPGRTDNEIKNYWNTRLKKRLRSQGLDPATHLPLDAAKGEDGDDDSDARDGEDGDDSDAKPVKKAAKPQKPMRQPRGPKPQLKMCQGKEGPMLLKVPKAVSKPARSVPDPGPARCKCDDDSDLSPTPSSCSTVTTTTTTEESSLARKLTSVPSYPEAELWKCIKPSAATSTAALLDEWDSYSLFLNPLPPPAKTGEPTSATKSLDSVVDVAPQPAGEDFGGMFQGPPEMGVSWNMDVEMGQPAPESLFAPNSMTPAGYDTRELQPPAPHSSQDLQKLAALLDLI